MTESNFVSSNSEKWALAAVKYVRVHVCRAGFPSPSAPPVVSR